MVVALFYAPTFADKTQQLVITKYLIIFAAHFYKTVL
jgi:hypothetical protein